MNKRLVFLLMSVSFIYSLTISCKKEIKESQKAWNPYSKNEILVFESSNNSVDTIMIDKIIDGAKSSGPTPKLYRHTVLSIYGNKLNSENEYFSRKKILEISSSTPNKKSKIIFELYFDNLKFGSSYELDFIKKQPIISINTKADTFNDVIKLEPNVYYSNRETAAKYMYWSKKHGFVKLEREDGFSWELVNK